MKITIVGNIAVIRTGITCEDFEKAVQYDPSCATLCKEDGTEYFKVAAHYSSCKTALEKFGATLNSGIGYELCIEIPVCGRDIQSVKEELLEEYSVQLTNLDRVIEQIKAVLPNIAAMEERVSGMFEDLPEAE